MQFLRVVKTPGMTTDIFNFTYSVSKNTMPHVRNKITVVRMAVARLELISLTPIFAKIAVRAANKDDSNA